MRLAVLGQGSIGRRHAGLLSELGHEVVAYDPEPPPPQAVVTLADTLLEAIEAADAVVVATPTSLHAEHACAALEAGRPTLVEKPLATTSADAALLQGLAEARGVALGVAMNLRFHPGPQRVRDVVASGTLGRIIRGTVFCGSYLPGWRPDADYRRSYSARASLGGGVLLDAVHEIDYLSWVLGPVARVSASLRQISDLELEGVEDVAHLELELACGAHVAVTLDYVDRDYHRGCRLVGGEGTVDWSWAASRVRVASAGGVTEHAAINDVQSTYRAELAQFVQAVAAGDAPATTGPEGVHALAVVDAARRSARTGAVEAVEPSGEGLSLRAATAGDLDRLLEWRNDPVTVAASFGETPVHPAQHSAWLRSRLADPGSRLWIAVDGGRPVGQVRVDRISEVEAEIHIGLAPAARGRGLAAVVLSQAVDRARAELGVTVVRARVRRENERSLRAFRRAGFRPAAGARDEITLRHDGSCT